MPLLIALGVLLVALVAVACWRESVLRDVISNPLDREQ